MIKKIKTVKKTVKSEDQNKKMGNQQKIKENKEIGCYNDPIRVESSTKMEIIYC